MFTYEKSTLATKSLFINASPTMVNFNYHNTKCSTLNMKPCKHVYPNMSSSTTTWSHKLT